MTDADTAPLAADEWPYLQIAGRLANRIRAGEFAPSGRIPSERDLADWYGVCKATIRHAKAELEQRGLIYSIRGEGTFTA